MTSLTIWCDAGEPPVGAGHTVLWDSFLPADAPSSWHSLPDEVHADRDALREAYLGWVRGVGQSTHRNATLVERMRIRPHLSYWWMTLPADFSLGHDSPVYAAVRLIALTRLADRLDVTSVQIIAADRETRAVLVDWARATGRPAAVVTGSGPLRTSADPAATRAREYVYRVMPPLAALRVLLAHLRLARRRAIPPPQHGGVTVVDYLAHLAPPANSRGAFGSNYWGPLVSVLDEHDSNGEPATYLHLSADQASAAVVDRDSAYVQRLTTSSPGPTHDLLHTHLNWRVLGSALRDYVRVVRFGLASRHAASVASVMPPGSLQRPFRRARRDQFYGTTAMLNCVWINLFESALRSMPRQRLGIYLMENQPWEMAFTTIWRQSGHGRLVGVIHSTALFWSTRLYRDPRDYWAGGGACPMPWPDVVAVNGPSMRAGCAGAGYPTDRMVDVEALRYLHLIETPDPKPASATSHVLVLGEYGADVSLRLIDLVDQAADLAAYPAAIAFRPHPAAAPIDLGPYPRIALDQNDSLSDALDAADLAVCGAISSAAVDAASRDVTTVLVSDPRTFFTSPAEDLAGTVVVRTAEDLAEVLRGAIRDDATPDASASPFFLDPGLPRWRALVSEETSTR